MTGVAHIVDQRSEEELAGIVADTASGAELAVEHGVLAHDFAYPPLRRVFLAAIDIDHLTDQDDRLDHIANVAGCDRAWLTDLVHSKHRTVLRDTSGGIARRVQASGARWRRYLELQTELTALTDGAAA